MVRALGRDDQRPGISAPAFDGPANATDAHTHFDEAHPTPLPKTKFLMLARQEDLARLETRYDDRIGTLTVCDGEDFFETDVRTEMGRAAENAFFARFLTDELHGRQPRLVKGLSHRFTDVGVHSSLLMNTISVLNLASLRDFEQKLGRTVDPRRFRMNILVEGFCPWEEMDWLDREVVLGDVKCRSVRLTRRCPATQVHPDTPLRDIDVPKELLRLYDNVLLGVYPTVEGEGVISVGDTATRPATK